MKTRVNVSRVRRTPRFSTKWLIDCKKTRDKLRGFERQQSRVAGTAALWVHRRNVKKEDVGT